MFIGIFFIALSIAAFAYGLYFINIGKQSERWPTVEAKVLRCGVSRDREPHGGQRHSFYMFYEYEINGRRYESGQFTFKPISLHELEEYEEKYRDVETVMAHYHPDFPERAVVETGVAKRNYVVLLASAFIFAIGVASLIGLF